MKTTWISTTWRCYKILQIRLVVVEYKYDRTALEPWNENFYRFSPFVGVRFNRRAAHL